MYDSSLWRHQFFVQKRSPKIVWKDSLLWWTFFSKTEFSLINLLQFRILAVVVEYPQTIRSQEICHTIEILSTTLPKSHKIILATFLTEITQNDVIYSSCTISAHDPLFKARNRPTHANWPSKPISRNWKCVGGYLYYQLIPYFEAENLLIPKIELVVTFEPCGGGIERFLPVSWENNKML